MASPHKLKEAASHEQDTTEGASQEDQTGSKDHSEKEASRRRNESQVIDKRGKLAMEQATTDITDVQLREVSEGLGREWEGLATHLGFSRASIFEFKSVNPHDENNQIFAMLDRWKQKQPGNVDKTDVLCTALRQVGRVDLAEQLRRGDSRKGQAAGTDHREGMTSPESPRDAASHEQDVKSAREQDRKGISDVKLREMAEGLGLEWEKLATHLGFSLADISKFKSDNPHNMSNQIFAMLVRWKQKQPSSVDQTGVLCAALRQVDKVDLTEQFREMSGHTSSEDLKCCQQQVIDFYKTTTSKIQAHPAASHRTVGIDELFIPLELAVKGKRTSRERVKLFGKEIILDKQETAVNLATWEDLFNPNVVKELNILLSGVAGCGKSTLLMRVANTWIKPGQLVKFKLVFLFELKKMKKSSCIVDAIFDQILPKNTKLKRSGLIQVINDYEAEIAFLLDGLDEISFDILNSAEGVFRVQDILNNRVLVKSCVLVTTRPHRIDYVLGCHSNYVHVQTLGFTNESIFKYIKKYFAKNVSSGDALILHLNSHDTLLKLAEIPLITLMLCILWENQEELPAKLTELYTQFADVLYSRRYGEGQNQQQKVTSLLSGLGRIALDGVIQPERERLIFEIEEFGSCASLVEEGCQTGILQQESPTSGLKKKNVVTFLHKSFQEYAAAIHLAKSLDDDEDSSFLQLKHITMKDLNDKEHLLRFCCGLSPKAAGHILDHVKDLAIKYVDKQRVQKFALLLFFESGSKELVSKLDLPIQAVCDNREELRVLSYYLECLPQPLVGVTVEVKCNSHEDLVQLREVLLSSDLRSTRLTVHHTMSARGTKELKYLEETLGLIDERLRSRLTLRVDIDEKSSFDAGCLSGCISRMSHRVGKFILVISRRSHRDIINFANEMKGNNLHAFCVWNANMRGHVADLASLVTPSLKELQLDTCGLVNDDIINLISILPAGHGLERLILDGNAFSEDVVKALTNHLRSFPKTIQLSLDRNSLDEDLVKQLSWQVLADIQCSSYADLKLLRDVLHSGYRTSTRLKQVTYIMSTQGTKEMQHLEETLGRMDERLRGRLTLRIDTDEKSSFEEQCVSDCISRMFHQVEKLIFVTKRRSHRDVSRLVCALQKSGLQCFGLHETNMRGHVADLAPLVTPSLKRFSLYTCGLIDDDITDLISILPAGHGLERLVLSGNAFSEGAVKTLTDHLRSFPKLTTLSLDNISLDEDVVKKLVWQIIPVIQCSSHADLTLLRDVLLSANIASTRSKQIIYTMSRKGTKELKHLEETLRQMDQRLRNRLTLRIDVDEKSSLDAECISDCMSRMSQQVGKFFFFISRRSHSEVITVANEMKECNLFGFCVLNTSMHGHVTDLAPLVTPSLKVMELDSCGLVDDDIGDLISILPTGHGLYGLFLDGNPFSLDAVKAHAHHLMDFPKLSTLSLDNMGHDERDVKQLVWQILPSLHCTSHQDLVLLKDALLRGKLKPTQKRRIRYTALHEIVKGTQLLMEILKLMDEGIVGKSQVPIVIDINQDSSYDTSELSKYISSMADEVESFIFVTIGRSRHEVISIVNVLKGCSLYGFGVYNTNMHGHVNDLAPLVTPSLRRLLLGACSLVDDDIADLIRILPAKSNLEELELDDNTLSPDAVQALTEHMRGFSGLTLFSLDAAGVSQDRVKWFAWRILSYIECDSYDDLMLLREVLLSGKKATHMTRIIYTMSTQGNREIQHLAETLELIDVNLLDVLHIRVDINEQSVFDVACVSAYISRMSAHQRARVTLLLRRRSCRDVINIVNVLQGCNLYGFGVRYVNLHGHMTDLAALETPALKHLEVVGCQLAEDDVSDLLNILSAEHGLEELDLDGNAFSSDAVQALRRHLQGFPKLTKLSIDEFGHGEDLMRQYYW